MGSLRKKGDRWYFSVELPAENGKRKRVERAGGKTKKEAQEKMKLFEAEVLKNGYKKECKMTFDELYNIWFNEYVLNNCKHNTINSYSRYYKIHIKPSLGNYKVSDIKARVLSDFFNKLKEDDKCYSSANIIRVIISSCLNYAIFPLEVIENNPCKFIKFPKFEKTKNKKDIIEIKDFETILSIGSSKHNFNNVCILLLHTGLRIGEALGLQWEDIDFDNKIIHVRHTLISPNAKECKLSTPKTRTSIRDIYFNDTVEKVLKSAKKSQNENRLKYGALYNSNNMVFTHEDGSFLDHHYFTNMVAKINRETNINFSMHTFRHTHATMLLQAGANMKDVQTRLGHADISTTMNIYVQDTEESKKKALDKFNDYIEKTSNI